MCWYARTNSNKGCTSRPSETLARRASLKLSSLGLPQRLQSGTGSGDVGGARRSSFGPISYSLDRSSYVWPQYSE